jgi:hypothetical protein
LTGSPLDQANTAKENAPANDTAPQPSRRGHLRELAAKVIGYESAVQSPLTASAQLGFMSHYILFNRKLWFQLDQQV